MSYRIYSTEAIVIQARATGERDRIVTLLTREMGIIIAKASGVRTMKSKLRSFIEPGTRARFSIVRGRDIWRVTNAVTPIAIKSGTPLFYTLLRAFRLIESHTPREVPVPAFFDAASYFFDNISHEPALAEVYLLGIYFKEYGVFPEIPLRDLLEQPFEVAKAGLQTSHREFVRILNQSLQATGVGYNKEHVGI